ncbi:MAG TPA: hypothetical protein VGF44_04560 [Terriglobales bacterium]
MESLKIFSKKPTSPLLVLQTAQSNRGHRGGVISMHRALTHLQLGPGEVVNSIVLMLFAMIAWLTSLPWACRFWSYILKLGLRELPLHAGFATSEFKLGKVLYYQLPFLKIEPILPTSQVWGYTCLVTGVLFAMTFKLAAKWTPIVYLLRALLIIQISALIYFALIPARFPHTPNSYMEGLITSGIALIFSIPFLFGLTYYIFKFSAIKKILITLCAMGYLVLFLPLQMLLQALLLQKTILFMPLLYIVFGMPLDVLLVIAIYSYGMTWRTIGDRT